MPSRKLHQLPTASQPPDLGLPDPAAAAKLEEHGGNRRVGVVPAVLATSLFVILVILAAAAFAVYRVNRRRRSVLAAPADLTGLEEISSSLPPPPLPPREPHRFSYEELLCATASFAPANKLGQGGFGPVFRGVLDDGREVAVKVMDDGSLQGEREFRNELSLATSMMQGADICGDPSRFVVSCVGFCSDDDDASTVGSDGRRGEARKRRKRRRRRKEGFEAGRGGGQVGNPEGRRRGRSISSAFTEEDEEGDVSCCEDEQRGRRLLLVYELMLNGSLQDALLDRKCPELMAWEQRFSIALDVARGIEFLHDACDPPVVHGDVKPSNILLDAHFSAKIADFGLARILFPTVIPALGDDASVAIADDLSTTAAETESTCTTALDETNHYLNIPAGMPRNISRGADGTVSAAPKSSSMRLTEEADDASPITTTFARTLEAGSASEVGGAYDKMSVDSGVELLTAGGRRWWKKNGSEAHSRDWRGRQDPLASTLERPDIVGRPTVKEYVMEWIGTELRKERPKGSWADPSTSNLDGGQVLPSKQSDHKKHQKRLDWWASLDDRWLWRKGKSRPAREWWREEFCEELTRKNIKKKQSATRSSASNTRAGKEKQWWERMMMWKSLHLGGRAERHGAWGRPKSGGVSSTPSMRGTVCYAAPEYGGGGLLSEKCDIYSFGVLLLVLISGRRPLQVTASPMSEFERANLISWARNLAYAGKLLDLIDTSLHSVDRDQALLCITIALLCLQRSPARRPMIKEVVSMLSGESEPPHLPLEFSPSPPSGFPFKSRRKAR
ncbi:unnamed protein product [Spirodela intermedia]|uniref:non-specific serine/threonine protein kinase n=1 Tax=Spirodela intermedia TaxID=51605 RepID=A0A7I8JS83_SPIIN|nr:unnamed protein product [Spirodela intermedia]CAA6672621.1 unnamed protein product [Spirodela intermedia]